MFAMLAVGGDLGCAGGPSLVGVGFQPRRAGDSVGSGAVYGRRTGGAQGGPACGRGVSHPHGSGRGACKGREARKEQFLEKIPRTCIGKLALYGAALIWGTSFFLVKGQMDVFPPGHAPGAATHARRASLDGRLLEKGQNIHASGHLALGRAGGDRSGGRFPDADVRHHRHHPAARTPF